MKVSSAKCQPFAFPGIASTTKRGGWAGACFLLTVLPVVSFLVAGCSHHALETGWANPCKVQVQFYAPPGASVEVRDCWATRDHQVSTCETDHRLELIPEEFSVFNLSPDRIYDFNYTTVEGFPGVSIYGQLEIHRPQTEEAKRFMAHAFVPVSLPSRYYARGEEHFYPVRGSSGVGLNELEMEHLRQGDLITKVYFVADLQKAWETIRQIDFHVEKMRSAETVLNTHLELVDTRFQSYRQESLYADPTEDSLANYNDATGYNQTFIRLEARRQRLENERYLIRNQIDDLLNEKRIRTRLLDSMKIINRRGSLVLATPENQWEFHDARDQVSKARYYAGHATGPAGEYKTGNIVIPRLGDVLLVMRIGGRHKQWSTPRSEVVAFKSE